MVKNAIKSMLFAMVCVTGIITRYSVMAWPFSAWANVWPLPAWTFWMLVTAAFTVVIYWIFYIKPHWVGYNESVWRDNPLTRRIGISLAGLAIVIYSAYGFGAALAVSVGFLGVVAVIFTVNPQDLRSFEPIADRLSATLAAHAKDNQGV